MQEKITNSNNIETQYPDDLAPVFENITNAANTLLNNEEQSDVSSHEIYLQEEIAKLFEADIADLLETLNPRLREIIVKYIPNKLLANVINDMNIEAAVALLGVLDDQDIIAAIKAAEDLEDIEGMLRCLGPKRRSEMIQLSGLANNVQLLRSLAFAPDTVGEMMEFFYVSIADDLTVAQVIGKVKQLGSLPPQCDKLFVTNDNKLVGVLPLKMLLLNDEDKVIKDVMVASNLHTTNPTMSIDEVADLFEKYDLISVPVLNQANEIIGRVTIDEVMYRIQQEQHSELFTSSGMQDEEDLYAPIVKKIQNRGFWIFINLITAILVSRIIGTFEGTIVQIVALASLMPVIASMAGNVGMQTATLVIRALTLNQINTSNWFNLFSREIFLGLLNGLFWGFLVGLFSLIFYQEIGLALVLSLSMTLVFVLAVASGFLIPITLRLVKGDPALGTAVIVTTLTDCIGFFTFLGLATKLLI